MSLALFQSKPKPEVLAIPHPKPLPNLTKMGARAEESLASEIERICKLPITVPLTSDEIDLVSSHYLTQDAYAAGERLRPEQALAMVHYNDYGGIFCTLGVGRGKTWISFMVANDCYKKIITNRQNGDLSKEARILLVVQANLLPKCENDIPLMRKLLKEMPPVYIMRGSNKRQRTMLAKSRRRGLYVCSYHTLQSKDATDVLEAIEPCCIICDEAQNVAGSKDSARAKRFRNFVNQYQPEVVPLSGTMTRKSIMEFWLLAKFALGDNNFLPNSHHMAEEWAAVLDSNAPNMSSFRNDLRPRPGPISHLTNWCMKQFPEKKDELPPNLVGFRRALAQRMVTAPGVICSTGEDPVDANLVFYNNPCEGKESRPGWDALMNHLNILVNDFQTPSGEELADARSIWGYRYQMEATGFYYDLYWRDAEKIAELRRIKVSEAVDILERSRQHHENHGSYMSSLRTWLKESSRPHLDTPSLVGTSMATHGAEKVGTALYESWKAWKESAFEGMEVRQRRPVRVCDFKVRQVADDVAAEKKHGGIVWYQHIEMGLWVMDELRARGLEPVHCPAGDGANNYLADTRGMKGNIIVASLAHRTGKDLQHGFCRNYFLQAPVAADALEQCFGRTHRYGQYSEEVDGRFYIATDFDIAHFNALLNDTAYMQQTTTQRHKLLMGSYTFRPRSIPYTALVELGASPKKADRRLLEGILV